MALLQVLLVFRAALAKSFSCCKRGFGVCRSTVEFRPTLAAALVGEFAFAFLVLLPAFVFCRFVWRAYRCSCFGLLAFGFLLLLCVSCGEGAALFRAFGGSKSLRVFWWAWALLVSSCRAVQSLAALVKSFVSSNSNSCNASTATQQGAAPDRLQPALPSLVPRFGRSGFRRRVSLVVVVPRPPM